MSKQVYATTIVLIILWAFLCFLAGVYAIGILLFTIALICISLIFIPIRVNLSD